MSDIQQVFDLRRNADRAFGKTYTTYEQIGNFISIGFKIIFLFIFLTINFLGLSVALNCNANSTIYIKIASAIYGFFFGFIYLLLNYYTYRVLTLKKVCIMNKQRLFPFIA
jgi:hypothetical protein